jgi:branched-chain amino acid transport system substrate-binding protein
VRARAIGGLAALALVAALGWGCAGRGGAPPPAPQPERTPPLPARPLLGVVVPQSGSAALEQYGQLVLEGVRLALEGAGAAAPELVVLDDAGDAERDPALVQQLEARGAVAVIGPLLSPGVAGAARARRDTTLALISPTASTVPAGLPNVYTLNEPDAEGSAALARYAAHEGLRRAALLYPRTGEYADKAAAFGPVFRSAGGTIVADVPYDSGTTTFRTPLRRIAAATPDALVVFAPERDVQQIAPQIPYYGVAGKGPRLFGGESWTGEEILRQVSPRYTNGVIASTPLVRESPAAAWQDFAKLYESANRRTLDTPFPALGYDAARLVLSALGGGRGRRRADVARQLAGVRDFRAATGVLSLGRGALRREPFLVRIEEGRLVPVQTPGEKR